MRGFRLLHSLLRRWQSLREREAANLALREELQFHLVRETDENIARGMSPGEARRAARAAFGSVNDATEQSYAARGLAWLDDLKQDLRYGLRTLRKDLSFSLVTVLTLALGIGACTAIFSLVNAVLLRSLPYGNPERLVLLFTPNPRFDLPAEVFGPSNADFFDLRKENHSFAGMTLFGQATYNLASDNEVVRVSAAKVDADFFTTLDAHPELGRTIDTQDEQTGKDHVVVISHALRQEMFAGSGHVLGRTLRLDGTPYEIIGVMQPEFGFPHKSDLAYGNGHIETTQLWLPSSLTQAQQADRDESTAFAIARLKPGVTLREAQAETSTLVSRFDRLHRVDLRGTTAFLKPFRDSALGPVRPLMWLLMGSVAFVLLIACGNAANLLLARAARRSHELGMRATLGAGRGRLLRQMLTESLLLSAAAGTLGIGLAFLFLHALLRLDPGNIPRLQESTLDAGVMSFAILVSLLTSVLFSTLPALSASRVHVAEFLKSSGMRGVMGDRGRMRSGLVVAQVALVVMLLTGTGLMLRSYEKVLSVHTGFSNSTVTASVQLGPEMFHLAPRYDTATKQRDFFQPLLDRIGRIRGVQAAGVVDHLPLSNSERLTTLEVEGNADSKDQLIELRRVTPGYLSAMQIPILQGRGFAADDGTGGAPVALVNPAFAKKYLGTGDPILQRIRGNAGDPWSTIVGVVGDVRNISLEAAAAPQIYMPFWQGLSDQPPVSGGYIAVRSSLPQEAMASELRSALRSVDPNLAIADIHTMGDMETRAYARRRFQSTLLTIFSAVAMFLAVVGVYGLLAYSVRQRTGEIGIRMALGSSRSRVVRLVLREGFGLLATGLVIGLAASLACVRLLAGFVYDVPLIDPVTFSLVPMLLFLATSVACLVPSWRAAAVDPIDALRHE
jgi:predicted permease